MKRVIKIIGIVIGSIIVLIAIAFAVYCYSNLHWYDKYERAIKKTGTVEKQVTLPDGEVINYGEIENSNPALLLIHGQGGEWEDYALVMKELAENWHIYAIDVYGHGQSSHDAEYYYIDKNGDDLIWFINNVIGESTVVSGHSNGALTAAYIGTFGGSNVAGVVLEDPPVFSTEGENWEQHFSYIDSFAPMHEYNLSDKSERWDIYYLEHCYWGRLFMKDAMPKVVEAAKAYVEKHPDEYAKISWLPSSMWYMGKYYADYDTAYGELFYNLTWHNGYTHEQILSGIEVPCIYLHAHESFADNGVAMCAATREQAERAVALIGDNCELIETTTSDHTIHNKHMELYVNAVNSLLK